MRTGANMTSTYLYRRGDGNDGNFPWFLVTPSGGREMRTRAPSLADCGLPRFAFAGFQWPRYLATLRFETLRQRLQDRKTGCTGDYYHSPTPNNRKGCGFYLTSSDALGLRYQWADDVISLRHTGWYGDDFGDTTIRGIVLRLPRGRGFLAGWSMGVGMASSIDYSPIFDNPEDAARCADSMAESAAERERDYRETDDEGDE